MTSRPRSLDGAGNNVAPDVGPGGASSRTTRSGCVRRTAGRARRSRSTRPIRNGFGSIAFTRTRAAPGTGTAGVPREQINTVNSYIDAFAVYGGTDARLEWLREGPVDGTLADNGARLLLDPGGLLPRRSSRGDASSAPAMALDGRLAGAPDRAMVAGDVRANENMALTATQTLFARAQPDRRRTPPQVSRRSSSSRSRAAW